MTRSRRIIDLLGIGVLIALAMFDRNLRYIVMHQIPWVPVLVYVVFALQIVGLFIFMSFVPRAKPTDGSEQE